MMEASIAPDLTKPIGAPSIPDAVVLLTDALDTGADIRAEAGKVVLWIERLLRGHVAGWWGDCWLTEARQVRDVVNWYTFKAAEQGFVIPAFPELEVDALAYMSEARRFLWLMRHYLARDHSAETEMKLADIIGRH